MSTWHYVRGMIKLHVVFHDWEHFDKGNVKKLFQKVKSLFKEKIFPNCEYWSKWYQYKNSVPTGSEGSVSVITKTKKYDYGSAEKWNFYIFLEGHLRDTDTFTDKIYKEWFEAKTKEIKKISESFGLPLGLNPELDGDLYVNGKLIIDLED